MFFLSFTTLAKIFGYLRWNSAMLVHHLCPDHQLHNHVHYWKIATITKCTTAVL